MKIKKKTFTLKKIKVLFLFFDILLKYTFKLYRIGGKKSQNTQCNVPSSG